MRRALWRFLLWLRFHLWQRRRFRRLVLERVAGRPFLVLPEVFNPTLFTTSPFMVKALDGELVPPGCRALDMGTGSGVGAVFLAQWAAQVVAVDVNPAAVRCAAINALLNQVEERVEVRHGDLFAPVSGERFDVVLFNPPYFRGEPRDMLDRAFRATDVVERFAAGACRHLRPGGHLLLLLSSESDERGILALFPGWGVSPAARQRLGGETVTLYRLRPPARQQPAPG